MGMVRFGPSGNDELFYASGGKGTLDGVRWVREELGLSAFEVSFGRGVRLSEATARAIGEEAKKNDVEMSAHAPYYINLAKDEALDNNYRYIEQSLRALRWLGGRRLVVHLATQGDLEREEALRRVAVNLEKIMTRLERDGYVDKAGALGEGALICVETMGKYKQIGDVVEIATLSKIHPSIIPCLDFGHINCILQGELQKNPERIVDIMNYLEGEIGKEKLNRVHIHWSAIEFGELGEKKHTTLGDEKWAFAFGPLARVIKEKKLNPVIISESRDIMAQDAQKLKLEFYSS